jgi:prepilin-type N-terminal cleavage/methylation domain-containing protein
MRVKRRNLPISNQLGFTLVEVMMVIAIIGVLSSMAIGEFIDRRKEASNKSAQSFTRNMLTLVSSSFANGEVPTATGSEKGTAPPNYPDFKMNPDMYINVIHADDGNDIWQYYLASEKGSTAYYFWVPGPACKFEQDTNGFRSDTIYDNRDEEVKAKLPGVNWRDDNWGLS